METTGVQNPDVCSEHVSLYIQHARNDEWGGDSNWRKATYSFTVKETYSIPTPHPLHTDKRKNMRSRRHKSERNSHSQYGVIYNLNLRDTNANLTHSVLSSVENSNTKFNPNSPHNFGYEMPNQIHTTLLLDVHSL